MAVFYSGFVYEWNFRYFSILSLGLTMAVAVGISAVNALTLSPALCALFLNRISMRMGRKKIILQHVSVKRSMLLSMQ